MPASNEPPTGNASREVRCSSESYLRSSGGSLVPHVRLAFVVSDGVNGSCRTPSAAHSRKRFHPLLSFTPLQSSPLLCLPLPFGWGRGLPWGCLSLFATSAGGVRHGGLPGPPPFRPRRFYVLDGLHHLRPRGFVSPHGHVQGSPFRDFPSRTAASSRRWSVPSRRWRRLAAFGFPSVPRDGASPSGL